MTADPRARQRIPKVPGLYWVIPAAIDFPVRVYVHSYPRAALEATLELCACGTFVTALVALQQGWEWYAAKPETAAPDPEFVRAVAGVHPLTSRPSAWQDAAASLRDVVRRAGQLPCTCDDIPKRGEPGWEELQRSTRRSAPAPLCLACSSVQAVAQALAAERESE